MAITIEKTNDALGYRVRDLFDLAASERAASAGISQAADAHAERLDVARRIAREIAAGWRGTVTADDVQARIVDG